MRVDSLVEVAPIRFVRKAFPQTVRGVARFLPVALLASCVPGNILDIARFSEVRSYSGCVTGEKFNAANEYRGRTIPEVHHLFVDLEKIGKRELISEGDLARQNDLAINTGDRVKVTISITTRLGDNPYFQNTAKTIFSMYEDARDGAGWMIAHSENLSVDVLIEDKAGCGDNPPFLIPNQRIV